MCVVSMIGDHYTKKWQEPWTPGPHQTSPFQAASKEDLEKLRKEVEEMKALLMAAKQYDERTGQKECHTDEKTRLLRKIAKQVGVDLEGTL